MAAVQTNRPIRSKEDEAGIGDSKKEKKRQGHQAITTEASSEEAAPDHPEQHHSQQSRASNNERTMAGGAGNGVCMLQPGVFLCTCFSVHEHETKHSPWHVLHRVVQSNERLWDFNGWQVSAVHRWTLFELFHGPPRCIQQLKVII